MTELGVQVLQRSSGPKRRPERVATTLGVSGESIRRDVPSNDMIAYLAGLFDGEGCVTYKKYWSNKREQTQEILLLAHTVRNCDDR